MSELFGGSTHTPKSTQPKIWRIKNSLQNACVIKYFKWRLHWKSLQPYKNFRASESQSSVDDIATLNFLTQVLSLTPLVNTYYPHLLQLAQPSWFYQLVAQIGVLYSYNKKARAHTVISCQNWLFSNVPKQISWVLPDTVWQYGLNDTYCWSSRRC